MVKIVKNQKNGSIFTLNEKISKDGIERGFYVCESTEITMEGGFVRKNKVTALLTVESSLAKELAWVVGKQLTGKIITIESFKPFYEGQPFKINPTTKDAVLINGQKVYRQSTYTDNMELSSSLLVQGAVSKSIVVDEILPISSDTALNK